MSVFLDATILWIHLFSAVLFVGGSFFMWIVVVPASHLFAKDEAERTQIVGKIAKQFGRIVNPTLVVLALTGIYNATWYLKSTGGLLSSYAGNLLLVKVIMFITLIVLLYLHNTYFGRKIVKLAREGRLEELKALRRRSRVVSFANLGLMIAILIFAVLLQTAI